MDAADGVGHHLIVGKGNRLRPRWYAQGNVYADDLSVS
jgi:hypothetical protein